jgi:hypothetical protein
MATTPTSSLSGATRRAALFDEIEKIAQQEVASPKKTNWKSVLKAGAGYAAGYATGHVGGMAIERGLSHVFKDKWPQMSPAARQKVLYPLLGAATVGLMAVNHAAQLRRQQALDGDE